MKAGAHTLVVGIGGGSGTGKSVIAQHLVHGHGGMHVDADREAHAVLDDEGVRAAIRAHFGASVMSGDGRVDRRRLGARVFASERARKALGAMVHPAVITRCTAAVARARTAEAPLVVIDAALLFEVELPLHFDLTIALVCDDAIRRARLLAQGGWSETEIAARLEAQAGMEKHFYKAGAVIDTGRALAAVLADVDAHMARIRPVESSE